VVGGLCAAVMRPATASATETRRGDYVEVKQGETVKGDIFLFCHRARVDGTVDGDVFVFSQDVNVGGHVKGDVIGFSQSVRISGQVDGNIRTFANNMTITGNVAKNVLAFTQVVTVDSAGKIGGSLTTFTGVLSLRGRRGRALPLVPAHSRRSRRIAA